ncbi:MAG: phosphate ABC transporter permease PstA [Candidatus Cloacimonetes bacterium]|jgi:phosphate transport system permease protein|nr:phosphate ABC transporter permease PstA [Candidatus Cloacimonadota bacterium]
MRRRKLKNTLSTVILGFALLVTALFLITFLVHMFYKGSMVLSWEFLTSVPRNSMTEGGIWPALVGTFLLTVLAVAFALPLGVMTAIWLTHYGKPAWLISILRVAINSLAGTPSIIFGLFGMAVFVNIMGMDVSVLAGGLTLAILALPVIINNTEEAIRTVPHEFTEASLALGATTRQTITRVVLPTALPNILTGAILSIGRVAGETAPIMFTAATFYSRKLPTSLTDEVMALPYHIYALMTEGTHPDKQVPIAYGTALVLLLMVLLVSATAIYLRYLFRRKKQW